MRIVTARRISQVFFLAMLAWFCIVGSVGGEWWNKSSWPINWLLQLDPLVAVGTMLATGTLYAGLLWALATVVLTVILGRFFCGWLCPFGTIHQFVGWAAWRGKSEAAKLAANKYRRAQSIKYYLLVFLLTGAAGGLIGKFIAGGRTWPVATAILVLAVLVAVAFAAALKIISKPKKAIGAVLLLAGLWGLLVLLVPSSAGMVGSLQTGLLDPIPLVHRSFNLVLLPIADAPAARIWPSERVYQGMWLIAVVFAAGVLGNLLIPRFYCRFICPLGALLGVLGRFSIWRIGKRKAKCAGCGACQANCEGACTPAGRIRTSECVLCMNCVDNCPTGTIAYQTSRSAAWELTGPDISRRGVLISLVSALAAVPVVRLARKAGASFGAGPIRPPGALVEGDFLARCIKCGQCMRVCPTSVLQPAGLDSGLEGLWTPVLNNRIGTSGCQLNCVECGSVCPTAAIRPITLDEKLGRGAFAQTGPIRLGMAFVDRSRCLPWAMGLPCIVCQENCPVSPKAIYVEEIFSTVQAAPVTGHGADELTVQVPHKAPEGQFATGDYYCKFADEPDDDRRLIIANTPETITISPAEPWPDPLRLGQDLYIQARLEKPFVDPGKCIGCGICEHECPVNGERAIRVTSQNESRAPERSLLA